MSEKDFLDAVDKVRCAQCWDSATNGAVAVCHQTICASPVDPFLFGSLLSLMPRRSSARERSSVQLRNTCR